MNFSFFLMWEQDDLESLEKAVNVRVTYCIQRQRNSALGNKSPIKYLKTKVKLPR